MQINSRNAGAMHMPIYWILIYVNLLRQRLISLWGGLAAVLWGFGTLMLLKIYRQCVEHWGRSSISSRTNSSGFILPQQLNQHFWILSNNVGSRSSRYIWSTTWETCWLWRRWIIWSRRTYSERNIIRI